jgi:hypothetical protein
MYEQELRPEIERERQLIDGGARPRTMEVENRWRVSGDTQWAAASIPVQSAPDNKRRQTASQRRSRRVQPVRCSPGLADASIPADHTHAFALVPTTGGGIKAVLSTRINGLTHAPDGARRILQRRW